ncbi:MAG: RecX family transcriptional regulator [Peptostreptococcaceae bacterium]|nr:RecX family transcriptional regulator [Peptostreptococcaceae bacterium]
MNQHNAGYKDIPLEEKLEIMSTKDIKNMALKYLAYRDHTVNEMSKHLKEKEFEQSEIDKAISDLLELKYLDDYNYCRKYMPYSAGKGKGKEKIKLELLQKGVEKQIIEEAMTDEEAEGEILSISEFERALFQGEKALCNQEITEKTLAKVGRRLSTLGYSTDIVYKVMGIIMKRSRGNND